MTDMNRLEKIRDSLYQTLKREFGAATIYHDLVSTVDIGEKDHRLQVHLTRAPTQNELLDMSSNYSGVGIKFIVDQPAAPTLGHN